MTALDPRDSRIADLEAKVARLEQLVERLLEENAELKRRLNQNSSNSNKPPSSDGPEVQRPSGKPSGKKRGGQPGHDPHRRELLPVERCRRIFRHLPKRCPCGSHDLSAPELRTRHQVVYLPELVAPVDEHQSFARTCLSCGQESVQPIPPEVLCSAFGPCVVALVAQLVGEYRLSRRMVRRLLSDLFGIRISLGAIGAQEQVVAQALERPVAEVRAAVQAAPQANADETGWRVEKERAWLWVASVAGLCTAFRVARRRNGEAARALLGESFPGVLISDRFSGYNAVGARRRQVCWAHLQREFVGWAERGGDAERVGQALLFQTEKMFRWWRELKQGRLSRALFQVQMEPVREKVLHLLFWAEVYGPEGVCGTAREILDREEDLFTFVDEEGIEPTNNLAERMLRGAVKWGSLCTAPLSAWNPQSAGVLLLATRAA